MSKQSEQPEAHPVAQATSPSHPGARHPAVAFLLVLLLLGLAVAAWVRIGGTWLRGRPVRQHLMAGVQLANQGMGPQAEAEWLEALRLDPNNADACRLLAEYYFSAHDWQKAFEALSRVRALTPREAHLDCKLAACYFNLGDEVHALQMANEEIGRDPDCVAALATAATLYTRMGEEARAVSLLRHLARLQPDDPVLQYMLGEALSDTYAYREARPVLEHVIRLAPDHSDAYAELGIGWIDDASAPDHLQRAEQALRKALELNPLNAEARRALGHLYLLRNQPRDAVPQLEEAVRLMPQSSSAPFDLAKAYDLTGQPAKAAAMNQRFLSLRDLSTQVSTLQKRLSLNPTVFDYPYQLGTIELRRGNYGRSYIWLTKAQELRPHDRRVTAALAQLSRMTAGPSRMAAVQDRIVRAAGGGPAGSGASAAASTPP